MDCTDKTLLCRNEISNKSLAWKDKCGSPRVDPVKDKYLYIGLYSVSIYLVRMRNFIKNAVNLLEKLSKWYTYYYYYFHLFKDLITIFNKLE